MANFTEDMDFIFDLLDIPPNRRVTTFRSIIKDIGIAGEKWIKEDYLHLGYQYIGKKELRHGFSYKLTVSNPKLTPDVLKVIYVEIILNPSHFKKTGILFLDMIEQRRGIPILRTQIPFKNLLNTRRRGIK